MTNKIFSHSTEEVLQLEEKLRQLSLANQRLARNSRGSTLTSASDNANSMDRMQQLDTATVVEEESLLKFATSTRGSATPNHPHQLLYLSLLPLLKLFLL